MSIHLSDDQLIDRLYALDGGDDHLESCPECQVRWSQIQRRRDEAAVQSVLPAEFFQQQRRRIQARLTQPVPLFRMMWVPATLAIALMAGLLITRSAPKPSAPDPRAGMIEAGWFEDTYSATRVLEPRAASPIRQLFREGPVVE